MAGAWNSHRRRWDGSGDGIKAWRRQRSSGKQSISTTNTAAYYLPETVTLTIVVLQSITLVPTLLPMDPTAYEMENRSTEHLQPDEVEPTHKPTGWWPKIYSFFGFQKGYNFPLWFIFGGAMLGFSLARLKYFSPSQFAQGAALGEEYWYAMASISIVHAFPLTNSVHRYRAGIYKIGITMHLVTVLPAGILMVWQFVPIIRHKFILFHRINGYIITILLTFGMIGALMIARRSFGGAVSTQAGVGLLVIMVIFGLGMAIYNVKRLQIDQHRAWMLRTMFYCGTIITMRLLMVITAAMLPAAGNYYTTFSCDEVQYLVGSAAYKSNYPQCSMANGTANDFVAVGPAKFSNDNAVTATALQAGFSMGVSASTQSKCCACKLTLLRSGLPSSSTLLALRSTSTSRQRSANGSEWLAMRNKSKLDLSTPGALVLLLNDSVTVLRGSLLT